MILGDVRVGKISLKKLFMGILFDVDELGIKGVEMSLVDWKWRNLCFFIGLKFGSFVWFWKFVVY